MEDFFGQVSKWLMRRAPLCVREMYVAGYGWVCTDMSWNGTNLSNVCVADTADNPVFLSYSQIMSDLHH